MKYQSKKNETITAQVQEENEKYKTVTLLYLSGPDEGKTFSVSTSTLKRWWKKIDDVEKSVEEILNIDVEKVNEPYAPKVTPHYIPKPKSVIEFEEKKRNRVNRDLPTQDAMVEQYSSLLSKVNKTYIVFKENSCWVERKSGYINIYATETIWEQLTNIGLQSRPNGMKDKTRPFVFKITTMEEYNRVMEVLTNV